MKHDYIICFTTVPSKKEGTKIANKILEKKLAACINIIGPIQSIYTWEKRIEESTEYLLIIKTTEQKYKELEELIKLLHSYKVPEIIAIPIIDGLKEYLDWIDFSTKL